jgi:undecaprenyl-diphosphatase
MVLKVLVLAIVQGFAELLPVSSSAHVVIVEKLIGLDPGAPEMTLLLVMLHTGTMFAVIYYFWTRWHETFFNARIGARRTMAWSLFVGTAVTGLFGAALIKGVERTLVPPNADVEQLFGRLELIAPALAAVGVLIIVAGSSRWTSSKAVPLRPREAALIGAVQALCLPFRGFSRSGATISTGMLAGVRRSEAEEFSFALAVLLTPPVIVREGLRLFRSNHTGVGSAVFLSVFGACCAFGAGVIALKWLTRWLESGRWRLFGIYCLFAAAFAALLNLAGY